MTARAPALDADLMAGLRRLKLAKVRAIAPEVLAAAKTQRSSPEVLLRTLVEAEIAARDESIARARLRAAGFPVVKTVDEFNLALSSVPQASFDYLPSLEWIRAAENLCLVGPAGTGKSHLLIALGHAAVAEGMRVRYFAAADMVESLYRGLADNSGARIIDKLLLADLGIASPWPFDAWGGSCPSTRRPRRCSTGCCTTPSSPSPKTRATGCARPRPEEGAGRTRAPDARIGPRRHRREAQTGLQRPVLEHDPRWGLSLATSGDFTLAIDIASDLDPGESRRYFPGNERNLVRNRPVRCRPVTPHETWHLPKINAVRT